MRRCASACLLIAVAAGWASAQFLNNRPYPTYSLERMPDTDFSCRDKILGGYYADPETQCQMFHVCHKVAGIGVQDFRFLCPNGTAFDQDHQICADWDDVDCDATTLYYSSDNFDLYRIGSGFESKAVKYGEDEEVFALQRAETGDIRLNREHQAQRINQQRDHPTKSTKATVYYNHNANSNREEERDIFKGSSSSNFFNNRNGGKETDEDDNEYYGNQNQNEDRYQRKKVIRKQQRKQETQTPKPTGFSTNFAGNSYIPTTSRTTTTTEDYVSSTTFRSRQRQRVATNQNQPDISVSTPAPFKTTKYYRQPTQYDDGQYRPTTPVPKPTGTENYPANFPAVTPKQKYNFQYSPPKKTDSPSSSTTTTNSDQYDVPKIKAKTKQTENYPTSPVANLKKATTTLKQVPTTKGVQPYPTTFAPRTNAAYAQISQQTNQYVNKQKSTANNQNNQQPTQYNQNQNQYNQKQTTQYQNQNSQQTTQYQNNQKQTSQYNQPQTTQYSQNYNQPQSTQYNQNTQSSQYNQNTQSSQYNQNTQSSQYNQNTQSSQYNQNPQSTQFNQKATTKPSTFTIPAQQQQQTFNRQSQPQPFTAQQFNQSPPQKQTTQYTQYTPTVPRITTPYSSTTQATRRSNRFDETQYDDGSYDSRYDGSAKDNNQEDEFLRTAQSVNIASSKNEYAQPKGFVSTTQKPRPFAATPDSPKISTYNGRYSAGSSTSTKYSTSTQPPQPFKPPQPSSAPQPPSPSQPSSSSGKSKDYDYAYYDTNIGSEADYDVGTDIEKSNKKQQ